MQKYEKKKWCGGYKAHNEYWTMYILNFFFYKSLVIGLLSTKLVYLVLGSALGSVLGSVLGSQY